MTLQILLHFHSYQYHIAILTAIQNVGGSGGGVGMVVLLSIIFLHTSSILLNNSGSK